jgi:hypothetical protein
VELDRCLVAEGRASEARLPGGGKIGIGGLARAWGKVFSVGWAGGEKEGWLEGCGG